MLTTAQEERRLWALRQLNLLDTSPAEGFDRITRTAAQLFDVPSSAISLTDVDRQWFKSRVGVDVAQLPRKSAPCSQIAESCEVLVLPDLLADETYRDSDLARSGARFYAGAPLTTRDGFGLGALCVVGPQPRAVSDAELASLRDLAAMVMAQIELQHAFGRIDPLSGLPNRTQFLEDLSDLSRDAPADEERFLVVVDMADSDQLQHVMRAAGVSYLDDLVREAAQALTAVMKGLVQAYHVSTTQFAFLSGPGMEEMRYLRLLERLLADVRAESKARFVATASVGVAPFVASTTSPQDALRQAHSAAQDARLTTSKVAMYSCEQDVRERRRFQLVNAFGQALDVGGQLRLVYQPRIDLVTGQACGAEALLRWSHPLLGDVSPAEFIPFVESTSLARATTAWVLEEACRQLARWRSEGRLLKLSINVTATNICEPGFCGEVLTTLVRHGLPASCIELELTETAVMTDRGQAMLQLEALDRAGVRLAIDDFGTGYSSLAYLQKLPVHVIKIDQSFVRWMSQDPRQASLVRAMIGLCHDLGYSVVAEGVEDQRAADLLREGGCDEAQGYLFARPMEPEGFERWLAQAGPAATRLASLVEPVAVRVG